MTVKELYEYAKQNDMENCKIIINGNGYDDEITVYTNEDIVVLAVEE